MCNNSYWAIVKSIDQDCTMNANTIVDRQNYGITLHIVGLIVDKIIHLHVYLNPVIYD